MKDAKLVWSDELGDLRKKSKDQVQKDAPVDESKLELKLRRMTQGKGRTVIEISNLPNNKTWCKDFAGALKKSLGVGGTYKNDIIEIHLDSIDKIVTILDKRNIKFKKTGG